jgi:alanyl-tRNA synthetase
MDSAEIRRRWLQFFADRGHRVVPSSSLIAEDPNLLLVNAGMVPFKPFFLREVTPPYVTATSVQKCVRTVDIDNVGRTTRHASFFQMCGNFSFGDYFKERAIPLAWELLTTPTGDGGYGLAPERLWVTVFTDDDEAADIWRRQVGVPEHRIQRRGMADNFWSMGVPGPCGPCSEIYYDRGPEFGADGGPIADEDRYLEVWNLVFMQSERGAGTGKDDFPILGDLPSKNIDTGMGLERMATLLQGVNNLYEIDTTRQVLDRACAIVGHRYGAADRHDIALRITADHALTAVMLIGDGVTPGNEGRGYVVRRMMRRAIRNLRLLGAHDPAMPELVATVIEAMSPQYPDLVAEAARISAVAAAEEQSFVATLRTGTQIFDLAAEQAAQQAAGQAAEQAVGEAGPGSRVLSGDRAFQLHDTYGFPIDLTLEMAAEQGLQVDEAGFRRLMAEQRERAKADSRVRRSGHADLTVYRRVADSMADQGSVAAFTGYDEVVSEATVRGLLIGGLAVPAVSEGTDVELVLDRTPFYAESGGQLADQGTIVLTDGSRIEIHDVQTPVDGLVVHKGIVRSGEVRLGMSAVAEVDVERRRAISRAHTATHLVHTAFREALGDTATQAGSENGPGRFRFDFAHPSAVPAGVLADVEARVNAVLAADMVVQAEVMSQSEARATGAMALFGEKYGDQVRVVSVGDWARELCGGTHAERSGQLGVVTLLGESSIGAGVRRVEALVGIDAYRFLAREHLVVTALSEALKAPADQLADRVAGVIARLRDAERELDRLRAGQLLQSAPDVVATAVAIGEALVVARVMPDGSAVDDLRKLALDVRGRLPTDRPVIVAVGSVVGERPIIVTAVNAAAQRRGIAAGALVRSAAQSMGGGGGGSADVAQGGGADPGRLAEALEMVRREVRQVVGG